ncbi:death-inducer obliterator 1-like [Panicum miliaceum]|uniref:Death-inducer obliterator 1-like n=1 Tax=Panicum miliaceum TaxID=4540 RepID=A0A3L6S562_PANMI|nr:death-inducer obliterator 1-like [Panicum miliaceum]
MELSKQARAQPAPAPGGGAASRSLPPAALHSPQPASHGMFGPGSWGAKAPTSSYLIVPMGGQPAQVGASSPNAPHLPGARPVTSSRVSLRPPQQVLSVHPALPGILSPQPPPPAVGKKMALSPKVQVPKPVQSQATSKCYVKKEPLLKAYPDLSETVRSKFRETLAAALCVDSDQQSVQQSAPKVSPIGSSSENKHADGTLQRPNTCISHGEGEADAGTDPKSVGSRSKQDDILSCRILGSNMTIKVSKDAQEQAIHVRLENDVLGNSTVSDKILQGHGPFCAPDIVVGAPESNSQLNSKRATTSDIHVGAAVSLNEPEFKRKKTSDGTTGKNKDIIRKGQSLALGIEEELFKLFGGVNKKYKEKGRSLLFNLKDKINPVLREQVLSGEITPKCLCSMTTDELASKELSAWRLAKAEELSKMVVLPNREVNVRLVRKTHKGEFHVEVEETDSISVGAELGSHLLSHVPSKSIEDRIKSDDRVCAHRGDIESDNTVQDGSAGIGNSNLLNNLECLGNEKTDLIEEGVVHDLKYTENLPEIMSWNELVEAPDSDIPLECHSTEIAQDDPSITDKAYLTLKPEKNHIGEDNADPSEFEFTCEAQSQEDSCRANIKSTKNGSIHDLSQSKQRKGCLSIKSSPEMMDVEKLDTGSASISGSTVQLKAISDAALRNDSLWEGTIQLTLSSLINVVAIFKSGEKPSTNEWRRSVEIKGRVRLTDFQEFLEQLPQSRSRAVTVTELRLKEGSLESGRQQFLQTINSYVADERVGLVKLTEGVELYLCPSHGKAAQILTEHLPKEHSGRQTMSGVSVIGVCVWRRPRISTETPTRHDSSKRQPMSISRKPQAMLSSSVPMSSLRTRSPASHFGYSNERPRLKEDATDDVPPGFGHGTIKDDDDLPEYDFVSISDGSPNVAAPHCYQRQQHVQAISPPIDQVRRLVHKYGSMYASAHPWGGDEDLPEWYPSHSARRYSPMQQQHAMVTPQLSSPVSHVYGRLPQQHAMPVQQPWNHHHMSHPAEAQSGRPGWRSSAQWQEDAAWHARFVVEPDTVGPEPTWLGGAREPWHGSWMPH